LKAVSPGAAKYKELIQRFISREISAQDFETQYLAAFKNEASGLPAHEFDILQELFADADDYVADPGLRRRFDELDAESRKCHRALDGEQLRDCARRAFHALYE
jgi:hypothetical protein